MKIQEDGVLETSSRYFFTPSSFAEQVLFYPTRVAHFFYTKDYHFSGFSEIGMQPSHHLHYMLFALAAGSMALKLDGRVFRAGKGDAVLFDCKRPHEYSALEEGVEFYWLVFDGGMMETLFDQILQIHGDQNVFPAADFGSLAARFTRLLSIASGPAHTPEIAISGVIYSILCGLFLTQKVSRTPGQAFIEKAMSYVDTHYREPLQVSDIAATAGLSASYFTRCFRQATGYSPYEYLTLKRIGAAKDLLLSSDRSIYEIACACGYNSEENFIRSFKNAVGVSPGSFRRYPV